MIFEFNHPEDLDNLLPEEDEGDAAYQNYDRMEREGVRQLQGFTIEELIGD